MMIDREKLARIPLVTLEEWLRFRFRALSHEWFLRMQS
jgi:hypothetical protein